VRAAGATNVGGEITGIPAISAPLPPDGVRGHAPGSKEQPPCAPTFSPEAYFRITRCRTTTGHLRKLSEIQGRDPMIVVLSRGHFCPKDRRQHEGLLQLHREMEVGYCKLVTISTDKLLESNEFRSGVGARWPFLSDPERIIQRDLDIAEYTDPVHNPMIPHTDRAGARALIVFKVYMATGSSAPHRRGAAAGLRMVLRKCRPTGTSAIPI
jgi:peroxiredoxin